MSGSLSLERGLAVLDALKNSDDALGVREISRRLQLSAAAVQRLLNTLAELGYVEQSEGNKRYRLGPTVLTLAHHIQRQNRFAGLADEELQQLARAGGFNGFLGVRRGSEAVYLLAVQSSSPVVIRASPGETMLLHATALGKALLIDMSDDKIVELLGSEPLPQRTARTVSDVRKLVLQLRTARSSGYTTTFDENLEGVVSVGAPLRDASGQVIAAISVAFPRAIGPQIKVAEVGILVSDAAMRISARLGFQRNGAESDVEAIHAAQ